MSSTHNPSDAAPVAVDRRNGERPDRRRASPRNDGQLELLAEMSGHLASSSNVEETVEKALTLTARYVKAEGGALFLLDESGQTLSCRASVGPVDITGITLESGQGIVGHCVQSNEPRIVRDVSKDPDFMGKVDADSGFTTRSILCAPLTVKETRLGAMELVNKMEGDGLFSASDLMMLETLASATALAILNARMAGELINQERVRRELELAAEIQRSLLPTAPPPGSAVYGINVPARQVSGDFYDFYDLPDGRMYFSLGDVSGKGMNAALLMSKTASLFRCLGKTIHEPGKLLSVINAEIFETASHGMFVTMACGIYDPSSGHVTIANAGHEPPLVLDRQGQATRIPASAPPLGILPPMEGVDFVQETELELGDQALYLFTDGVTEGKLAGGEELGADGLIALLNSHVDMDLPDRIGVAVNALTSANTGDLHDDLTLLGLQRGGRDGG